MRKRMNQTRNSILKSILIASCGLAAFGFGIYMTIQANIGARSWDVFNIGLASVLGLKYGTTSILVSVTILIFDVLMKEKIGIGMLLDAFIAGKAIDLFNYLDLIPKQENPVMGVVLMIAGMTVMGFAQAVYMKTGLGCGPRDGMLVGLHRRLPKIPIGLISMAVMLTVTTIGFFLGGPLGLGTVIGALFEGPLMQMAFRLSRFEPTAVEHQDLVTSLKIIFGRTDETG